MVDRKKLEESARRWIEAWNTRDMDAIMDHYADDVVLYSPSVIERWSVAEGRLAGKAAVEQHFTKGLDEVPDTRLEFLSLLYGIEGVTIVYRRETGSYAADVVLFDDAGKVKEVRAFY